jgi:hypothetical protein
MRRASRITASVLGLFAGGAGIEHGIYEILQGNVRPDGLMINSMGPPCRPEAVWHACEPAMTILPSFLITGILAVVVGSFVILWSLAFVQRKRGGLILMLASILMLLFGGGIFPPLIGIVGGAVGTRISRRPARGRTRPPGAFSRILSRLWPWTLVVLAAWLLGQWLVGHFFNDFLMGSGFFIPILVIGLLVLSVLTATAHDSVHGDGSRAGK